MVMDGSERFYFLTLGVWKMGGKNVQGGVLTES